MNDEINILHILVNLGNNFSIIVKFLMIVAEILRSHKVLFEDSNMQLKITLTKRVI